MSPSASGANGYSGSAIGWIQMETPCSCPKRPCPERWSACVWVSSTRRISTPASAAASRYCSIANAGSTTAASPLAGSPMRYEPQPRSSSTNCLNSTEPNVSAAPGGFRRRSGLGQAELTGDHHALHLVGALADLEDLLVAIEPRDRVLVHEPVPAVDLQRPVRRPVRELAGKQLGHRGGASERPALILLPGGPVDEQPGGFDLGGHVDELRLHRLGACDRAAELAPLERVGLGKVVAALRQTDAHRSDGDPAAVEDLEELVEPLAPRAQQVALGHAHPLERELAGVGRAPAELVHRLRDHVPRRAVLDDQVRDLALAGQ